MLMAVTCVPCSKDARKITDPVVPLRLRRATSKQQQKKTSFLSRWSVGVKKLCFRHSKAYRRLRETGGADPWCGPGLTTSVSRRLACSITMLTPSALARRGLTAAMLCFPEAP
jgi:hypothetical protein